jgi:hypothetical protein
MPKEKYIMCKIMKEIDTIIEVMNYDYKIKIDYGYIEKIKRISCSHLCSGKCQDKYLEKRK